MALKKCIVSSITSCVFFANHAIWKITLICNSKFKVLISRKVFPLFSTRAIAKFPKGEKKIWLHPPPSTKWKITIKKIRQWREGETKGKFLRYEYFHFSNFFQLLYLQNTCLQFYPLVVITGMHSLWV